MLTENQVIERALRSIGVVAADEAATADQFSNGNAVLTAILGEIGYALSAIPDHALVALSEWLAGEVSPDYGLPRSARGKVRLMGILMPDDRTGTETDYTAVYY